MASISKVEFVAQLGELLKNAGLHVKELELHSEDIAVLYFDTHRARVVAIGGDSYAAIALDVIRAAVYQ